ncbi:MAG TPA: filamentous hemagglutinin N-terminal domain-containing protein [Chlamydiales bacterium]|nr:filamentous hemagglutinin N-terminal domain-containing protein [Chlamydiales bacterium]
MILLFEVEMKRSLWVLLFPIMACANPSGESVSAGDVSFSRHDPATLTVHQGSERAIVQWQDFSIGAAEETRFVQPGKEAVILNQVMGPDASAIYGRLEGNGKVFLVNPQGILVGPQGVIQVATFLGTTAQIDKQAFMKNESLVLSGDRGTIENRGLIQADGVFLCAERVIDSGKIASENVVKGEQLILQSSDNPDILIRPAAERCSADNFYALAVNREGRGDATEVRRVGSRVFLTSPLLNLFETSEESGTKDFIESDLEALQQIRTLIPERLWVQEFAVYVNRKAFRKSLQAKMKHKWMDEPRLSLAQSRFYYLKSTMSGEWARIDETYEEFEHGPFWKNPPMLDDLHAWERQEMKQ